MNAIKLAYKERLLPSPWQWVGAGLSTDLTVLTLVWRMVADGFLREEEGRAASKSLMSANILKEDAGPEHWPLY